MMPVLWQRQCEASAAARRENGVLPDLMMPSHSLSYAMIMQARAMRDCSHIAECSLSYAMIMQMSGIRTCSYLPECSLSYAKII